MLQFYLSIIFCHMLSCVFDNLLTINVWWWWWDYASSAGFWAHFNI